LSYIQRVISGNESPFAQTSNSSQWDVNTAADTTTAPNWMTTSGNGYSFSGSGYVFGFVVPANDTIMSISVGDSNPGDYQRGMIMHTNNAAARVMSDDQAVSYGSNTIITEVYVYTYPADPDYQSSSRVNVIRMEL
jgi:hypothetical protein